MKENKCNINSNKGKELEKGNWKIKDKGWK